jgi:integrase
MKHSNQQGRVSQHHTYALSNIREDASIAELLSWYANSFRSIKQWGRTKQSSLSKLQKEMGSIPVNKLTKSNIIQYAIWRRENGAGPVSIAMDLSALNSALSMARCVGCQTLSTEALKETRVVLTNLSIIGPSIQRRRRPSINELNTLIEHFDSKFHPRAIPVHKLMQFALATAMRLGEIVRIEWKDIDHHQKTIIIRDRKHPRLKKGNHDLVPLLPEAWSILEVISPLDERIFPYRSQSVSRAFWEACNILEIDDLRFHDLRHEAITRLFENGLDIHQVAVISGHKDWRSLQRYTHIDPISVLESYRKLSAGSD